MKDTQVLTQGAQLHIVYRGRHIATAYYYDTCGRIAIGSMVFNTLHAACAYARKHA